MAKILLIISALVIAATAYLGFATKQKVEEVQGQLKEKKTALITTQGQLATTKTSLKKSEDELVAAKVTIEEKDKDIIAKKGEIDGLGAKLKEASDSLAVKTEELDKLKIALGGNNDKGPDVEQMKAEFEATKKAKADLEVKVAELTQVQDTLNKQLGDEKSKAASAETQVKAYKQNYTRQGVTGTVLAYNPGWNFVVLSIGDKQSLKAGKEMVVTRGGQMVAKVRVTSVEPSTSIADIIPSSVAKGQSVQPGDSVVYEGRGSN